MTTQRGLLTKLYLYTKITRIHSSMHGLTQLWFTKFKLISILITLIIVAVISGGCNIPNENKSIIYNTNFANDVKFIKSNDSENFDYSATISVNGLPNENGNVSLNYQVGIDLKDKNSVLKEVTLTCRLNESIKEILVIKTREYFGNDLRDKIILNKSNHGLITALTTWIDATDNLQNETINEILEHPLEIMVVWSDGVEYATIQKEDINVIWH